MKYPNPAALLFLLALTPWTAAQSVDAPAPAISITDPSLKEGNGGQKDLTYTVTLDAPSATVCRVDYTVVGASATQGQDFTAHNGTLTFSPGQRSKTVSISVLGDNLNEANELVFVNLSNPVDATLAKARGIGTILNDDPLPTLRIAETTVIEGNTGQQYAYFHVKLNTASGQNVSVQYQTEVGGSPRATPYVDYAPLSLGTLNFAPGETHKTARVPIFPDIEAERDEQFVMRLSNPINARIVKGAALATIFNDDGGGSGASS